MQAHLDEWVHRRRFRAVRRRQQLRVGLRDVVALHEGFGRQLPVDREQARLPPLGAQRTHLPFVVLGREWFDALAQRRCTVVEVDPGAATPQLTPNRDEAEIIGAEVAFVEYLGP